MSGWKRSFRLPARLTRWINTLHAVLHHWSRPYRRLHDGCLALSQARRQPRPPLRFCLEALEDRQMLDANALGLATAALGSDVAQWRNDVLTSAAIVANSAPSSPANSPTPAAAANPLIEAESVLAADFSRTWQAVAQVAYTVAATYVQTIDTLRADWYASLSGHAPSPAPPAQGRGSGTGSMGNGHGNSNQGNTVLSSGCGTGSGTGSAGYGVRTASVPLLGSGSGSGSGSSPTLQNPGDQNNWQGDAVDLQLSGSDPDGDTLTYSSTGLPSGLTLNPSTGVISGMVNAPDATYSPYNVTVTASDGVNSTSQSFNWNVTTVQFDPVADQTNLLDDSNVSVPLNAFSLLGQPISYSATGLPPGLSINPTTGVISGAISNGDSITSPYNITVTATDGTGTTTTTFNWNVNSFSLNDPGDQSNGEGNNVALQLGVASNGNPNLTFSATGLPPGLSINPTTGLIAGTLSNLDSNNSPYSVTVTATDGTTSSNLNFNWTVTGINLTDPGDQINAPGNVVSLPLQANDPDGDTLNYSATGLPSGLSLNTTTGLISGTIASTAGSGTPYSVTVSASDGSDTASDTLNWTVANGAVSVTNPGTQHNAENDNVSLQINATDPSGNGLTYSAVGLPSGLQIDPASGLISGTVDEGDAESNGGVYTVTVLADDGQGNNGSTTFTWNVSDTNTAPTLDNPGDLVDHSGDVVSLPLVGYDGDGESVTYSVTGLPPGLSLNTTSGIISGTLPLSAASNKPYSVTVTASDGTLTTNQSFNWFVTGNPVTLTSPGDQTSTEGNSVSLQLSGSDAFNGALSYQASGLPPGLSINSGTGLISGTIASGAAANAPYLVTITATDSQTYGSGQQFVWNVNPANLNPVLTNPGSQINAQGDVLSLQVQASDPPGNGLTYSATALPPGLTIDPSSGLISGVVSSSSGSSYTVTVTATDGSYNGSTTFTWSITNQAAPVTNPGAQSGTGGQSASLQMSASDPHGYPLTYAAVGLPPGLSINPSTGLISGTISSSAGGAFTVTVMASDSYGNSGSTLFTWNVAYVNQAPTLDNPGAQLNNPGDLVSLQLSGSDVDGDNVTYSATGLPPGLTLNQTTGIISGTLSASAASTAPYTVTATASDGTLTSSQTFNWFVPLSMVTLTNPGDQSNTEGDNVSLQLSALDASRSPLTYQSSGLPAGLSINSSTGLISGTVSTGDSANGPYSVTVAATDSQGYSGYQQFNWTINAPTNALTLTNPGNLSNAEGGNVSLQIQANDPDGDTLEYAASGLPIGLMIDPTTGLISGTVGYSAAEISSGKYNVTVTVNDGEGQTVTQSFVWTISDTPQAPWLSNPDMQDDQVGQSVSLQLDAIDPESTPLSYTATGLPSGLTLNATTGLISGAPSTAGDFTVTATAAEDGLSSSQTFDWDVAPTGSAAPQVILTINGSADDWDHVLLLNSNTAVPMVVKLENASPGTHQVQISIPSDGSTVSDPTLQLSNGGSATVMLQPKQSSKQADDIDVVAQVDGKNAGDAKETNIKVTFPPKIQNADTPAKMNPRIPPRVGTPLTITLSAVPPPNSLQVAVKGNSDVNGWASFSAGGDAWPFDDIYPDALTFKTNLIGLVQTEPTANGSGGNAGKLYLQAQTVDPKTGNVVQTGAKSSSFSVAAIPITVKMKEPKLAEGEEISKKGAPKKVLLWGAIYPMEIISDSGQLSDLSEVQISEVIVNDPNATGLYANLPKKPIEWIPGAEIERDKNGSYMSGAPGITIVQMATRLQTDIFLQKDATGLIVSKGQMTREQYFIFSDARTGVPANVDGKDAMIVRFSGFEITRLAEKDGNNYFIKVTRKAKANHGAEAGENASSAEQKAQVKG